MVTVAGAGAALAGLFLTWLALVAVGISPGNSNAARLLVGGPIHPLEGAVWFYFDTHWVLSRTGPGLSSVVVLAHPLEQADPTLWPLHAIPGMAGVGGAAAVRYLGVTDGLDGSVVGASTALGYLPTMSLLRSFARVPLTRHASNGRVPIFDADGVPVSHAEGVTAGPDLLSALLFVALVGVVIGGVGGASAVVRSPGGR
ncbi:MAG: hypothetical protein ABEH59_09695 [Halobacteriales archaeon]